MSVDPEGTPAGNSPDPTDPVVDWEQRFKDTQAAYTKSQQELATERAAWEDEQALLTRLAEKHPHLLIDEEEPETDPEPPTADPQIAQLTKQQQEFQAWQQQVEADRAQERFTKDLAAEAGDREIAAEARDWIYQRTIAGGNNRDALTNATKAWFEFEDRLRTPPEPKRPRVPHVPTGGGPAGGGKDTADMTRQELSRYMLERIQAETA